MWQYECLQAVNTFVYMETDSGADRSSLDSRTLQSTPAVINVVGVACGRTTAITLCHDTHHIKRLEGISGWRLMSVIFQGYGPFSIT